MGRRCIGLDVHREFAQVAIWENGQVRHAGQVEICGESLRVFADSLGPEDEVAIEATCNTHAIVRAIEPRVARVIVSNPMKTRAIAEAKVKTDKVDAAVLAELWRRTICRRCGFLMRTRRRCAGRSRGARRSSGSARD